jgi:hypothetical protein
MAKLQKIETTNFIYEYELSDDEYQQYLDDSDLFWDTFEEDWGDCIYEDVDSIPTEINLIEE